MAGCAAAAAPHRPIHLVLAPSSLGLRPLADDAEPGAWRAPQVLVEEGLSVALGNPPMTALPKPVYRADAQENTRIRNGHSIRTHALSLSNAIVSSLVRGRFPVVVGGDCSIMLGCLLAMRRADGAGLIHVDGHSDFYHPGNYDAETRLGSVAGMDLALATGRGEALLTAWPRVPAPLVKDQDVIQVGERDANAPGYDYADIAATKITRILIWDALDIGIDETVRRIVVRLKNRALDRAWLHVDLDVLDDRVMPAVDSPGSPGLDFQQLASLISGLRASGRIMGADFTIYDPDLDPTRQYARQIVACLAAGLAPSTSSRSK